MSQLDLWQREKEKEMANAVAKKPETKPVNPSAMSDELRKMAAAHVGAGSSTAQEDNLIPLIYVLQGLSPQVNKRNDAYIKDAEPGDIWLRNSPREIVKGSEGIIFQQCAFAKNWVEWVPRDEGGGRRGIFPHDAVKEENKRWFLDQPGGKTELSVTYKDNNPNIPQFKLANGNDLIETRYHTGFAEIEGRVFPFVISFKSTGHTVSREWMGKVLQHSEVDGKNPDPSWLYFYRLTTRMRKNKEGEWFVLHVQDVVDEAGKPRVASVDEYKRGLSLHNAVLAGEKEIGEEVQEHQDGGTKTVDEAAPF